MSANVVYLTPSVFSEHLSMRYKRGIEELHQILMKSSSIDHFMVFELFILRFCKEDLYLSSIVSAILSDPYIARDMNSFLSWMNIQDQGRLLDCLHDAFPKERDVVIRIQNIFKYVFFVQNSMRVFRIFKNEKQARSLFESYIVNDEGELVDVIKRLRAHSDKLEIKFSRIYEREIRKVEDMLCQELMQINTLS